MISQLCVAASNVLVKLNFGFDVVCHLSIASMEMIFRKFEGHSPVSGAGDFIFSFANLIG